MAIPSTEEAQDYAKSMGLTSWEIGMMPIIRAEKNWTLTLRQVRSGKKILISNTGDFVIVRSGDLLEMLVFNRYVKRLMMLNNKEPIVVRVALNKKGALGIEYNGRFMPFEGLRGEVIFRTLKVVQKNLRKSGEITTI